MKVSEKNIQQQIQFWALIGPFVSLLTLLVSLMKESPIDRGFAVVMILGIPLCWKWKLRGLAISLGLLFGVVAYHYLDLTFADKLWAAGVSIAASLSFLVTALSFDEVASLLNSMEVESKSRLDNLLQLDEKLKEFQENNNRENNKLQSKLEDFELDIARYKDRAEASEKLAQVVREELATTHSKQSELQQEIFEWRHKYAQASRKIEQLEEDVESISKTADATISESEEYKQLQQDLNKSISNISALESQLVAIEEEKKLSDSLINEQDIEIKHINEELKRFRQQYEESKEECIKLEESLIQSRENVEALAVLKDETSTLMQALQEKDLYIQKLETASGENSEALDSLKDEISTHMQLLQEKDLYIQKLKLGSEEKDRDVILEKQKNDELQRNFSEKELVFQNLIHEGKLAIQSLQLEKDTLSEKLEELEKVQTTKTASKQESSELRKIKGKYNQLKQQFDEKSQILDDTRRALFHMQEKLVNIQREYEDMTISAKSEKEKLFEEHIQKMEEEQAQIEKEHQEEINGLHEIIASLSVGKVSAPTAP